MSDKYADVAGMYKHHTVSAVLIELDADKNKWIPLTLIDLEDVDLNSFLDGQAIELKVQTWWAEREGLV